jgi:hypothetical protein
MTAAAALKVLDQAHRLGLIVLTANVSDDDILLQLIPSGRILFYRRK